MDEEAVNTVLQSLQQYRWGWQTTISTVAFIGEPVGLRVDTQPIPTGGLSPILDETERSLVRLILGALPTLLPLLEREYRGHADGPDIIERLREPSVWLSRDVLADEGPDRWSFVAGIADAPDWGIHADFAGLVFQRIWS